MSVTKSLSNHAQILPYLNTRELIEDTKFFNNLLYFNGLFVQGICKIQILPDYLQCLYNGYVSNKTFDIVCLNRHGTLPI
jgi:hypothetical protein